MTDHATHSALIITNPHSGNGRGPKLARQAGDRLIAAGWDAEVVVTEGAGHAERVVRDQGAGRIVFSCGGDGTLNNILPGAIDEDAIVGVIPAGTANDLARAVGISLDPQQAIAHLTDGRVRKVDLLEIDGGEGWAAVAVGVGIDARTVERARQMGERQVGRGPSYVAAAISELGDDLSTRLRLQIDGEGWEGDALLVQVANCPNHGGAFTIAPGAEIDDGRLDVVLVETMERGRALELIPRIFAGDHLNLPEVRRWSAREVTIAQPHAGPAIIDGEVVHRERIRMRVAPGRLRLWIPEQA
jgi:diacylglycerol kinase (ATP)